MPKKPVVTNPHLSWDPGTANPKQRLFYYSRALYTCYGGAKGGGKTHAVRVKAVGGAYTNPGIKILIMRKTYPELEDNHIRPILKMIVRGTAAYNGSSHILTFDNGSTIKFGHWSGEQSEDEYNGLEYDWIFIDEATQFSERAFNFLGGCLRGTSSYPKRMYLTCNPGGVGHRWVKRLFIDKKYKVNPENPEESENPNDYNFIFATVDDNTALLKSSPSYLRMLANMPEDKRRAYRYGDWNAIGGNYFPEFSVGTHVTKPFQIPSYWQLFRSFDYGLDMFHVLYYAIDTDGRTWVFREYRHKNLIVQDAAKRTLEHSLPGEAYVITYAPPDMWSRQKDTGRTMAELFMANGLSIVKSDNNRVQGHMMIKDMLTPMPLKDPYLIARFGGADVAPKTLPGLMFFDNCTNIISDLQDIQADDDNPNDCAKDPHEVTHSVDCLRYFCVSRHLASDMPKAEYDAFDDDEGAADYDSYMCGGKITDSYVMGVAS